MPDIRYEDPRASNITVAFQNLTDGLYNLFRQHLELVRHEVKEEATEVGKQVVALGLFVVISLVGYGLLNVTAILFAGWFGGIVAMTLVSLALTLINLLGGGYAIKHILGRLQDNAVGLPQTNEEIQRNKQWIKQIRDNSSSDKALPSESL